MARKIFTRDDLVWDFLDYIEAVDEQCQEAKDYYHSVFATELTLGEAIDQLTTDPNFIDNWASYCYLAFPRIVDKTTYDGFKNMADVKPTAHDQINEIAKHKRKSKAIKPKNDKLHYPPKGQP